MPETATALPPSVASTFASMLSGLVSPKSSSVVSDRWDDDELSDDVSTLSYEQALRTQTRYRPSNARTSSEPPSLPNFETSDAFQGPAAAPQPPDPFQSSRSQPPRPQPNLFREPPLQAQSVPPPRPKYSVVTLEESRKSASITIRLSTTECDQLRERATAAGLTVSAYLRSCVFEIESLRAEVKNTLAQLRSESVSASNPASITAPNPTSNFSPDLDPEPTKPAVRNSRGQVRDDHSAKAAADPVQSSSIFAWIWRLLTPWHRSPRTVNA